MSELKMILGEQVREYLKLYNVVDSDGNLTVTCMFCGTIVESNQIQFIIPPQEGSNQPLRVVCANPICVQEYLDRNARRS